MSYTIKVNKDLIAGHLVTEMILLLSGLAFCAEWFIKDRIIEVKRIRKVVPTLISNAGLKRTTRNLTMDEWHAVNNLIQDVLDRKCTEADVWSTPNHIKGRLWLREGTKRCVHWDKSS